MRSWTHEAEDASLQQLRITYTKTENTGRNYEGGGSSTSTTKGEKYQACWFCSPTTSALRGRASITASSHAGEGWGQGLPSVQMKMVTGRILIRHVFSTIPYKRNLTPSSASLEQTNSGLLTNVQDASATGGGRSRGRRHHVRTSRNYLVNRHHFIASEQKYRGR